MVDTLPYKTKGGEFDVLCGQWESYGLNPSGRTTALLQRPLS